MLGATLSFFIFWRIPTGAPTAVLAIFIILSAFFVYGPQALLGVSASQYATKKASASSNGFVGVWCYAASMVAGVGFGWLADTPGFGWNAVFITTFIFGLLGAAILLLMWKAPADGYEKAKEVIAKIKAEEE
jgi:OPA family glycerol-3-phosphate transporter-like MFS transporter/OPA family sugar phosphate sensor protein UhpC-like MFS transporter